MGESLNIYLQVPELVPRTNAYLLQTGQFSRTDFSALDDQFVERDRGG